jgi:diaminohydroxyphosphoribosylaminopyrimidine deaminase/5-amino-6-(5-phosphoribosylamino)uracil reductase
MTSADDVRWMQRALRLAARGRGNTSPNPMVGAVIVRRARVAGAGYHRRAGGPHAEIFALRQAGAAARGATMYVTLEPCCHHGRTPPCTEAIIAARLARVVVACVDPNPSVNGRGIRQLRRAGIEVQVGVLQGEAQRLNRAYLKHTETGLPLVSLKAAMSLDGKIATARGEARWITGEPARAYGHRLRSYHDAVLVGVGTVLADDPELTVRMVRRASPLRVVVDSRGRTPPTARLLSADERRPVVAVTRRAPAARRGRIERAGAEVWVLPSSGGGVSLRALMKRLGERGVQSVLVEGGGKVAAGALAAGLVDRVYFFLAPRIIGGASAPTSVEGEGARRLADAWRIERVRVRRIGEDILVTGDVAP